MKNLYLLFIILVLTGRGYSQGGSIPTVRQVYDFAVGDTFEYYITSNTAADVYYMNVVLVRTNFANDSIIYVTKGIKIDSGATMQKDITNSTVLDLDSPCYKPWITAHTHLDSAVAVNDSFCITRMHSGYSFYCNEVGNYVNGRMNTTGQCKIGLGATDTYNCLTGTVCDNCNDTYLMYFHKADGSTGGTPYDFAGAISDLINGLDIKVFPNPVNDHYELQLSATPPEDTYLQIFDNEGNLVKQELIHSLTNTYSRGNLVSGLYFWQVTLGDDILKRGQMIVQ